MQGSSHLCISVLPDEHFTWFLLTDVTRTYEKSLTELDAGPSGHHRHRVHPVPFPHPGRRHCVRLPRPEPLPVPTPLSGRQTRVALGPGHGHREVSVLMTEVVCCAVMLGTSFCDFVPFETQRSRSTSVSGAGLRNMQTYPALAKLEPRSSIHPLAVPRSFTTESCRLLPTSWGDAVAMRSRGKHPYVHNTPLEIRVHAQTSLHKICVRHCHYALQFRQREAGGQLVERVCSCFIARLDEFELPAQAWGQAWGKTRSAVVYAPSNTSATCEQ